VWDRERAFRRLMGPPRGGMPTTPSPSQQTEKGSRLLFQRETRMVRPVFGNAARELSKRGVCPARHSSTWSLELMKRQTMSKAIVSAAKPKPNRFYWLAGPAPALGSLISLTFTGDRKCTYPNSFSAPLRPSRLHPRFRPGDSKRPRPCDANSPMSPCVRMKVLSPWRDLCEDGGITEPGPVGRRGSAGKEPVGRLDGGPPAGAARGPGHLRRRRA
jgi:hypothetical protein